jgi:hypothetical protein
MKSTINNIEIIIDTIILYENIHINLMTLYIYKMTIFKHRNSLFSAINQYEKYDYMQS